MSTEKNLALCLLVNGKDKLTAADICFYSDLLNVSTRSIYRYLEKIARAKFLVKKFYIEP